jgi:hypothetical protein
VWEIFRRVIGSAILCGMRPAGIGIVELFLPLTDHSLLAWRFGVRVREGDPGTRGPRGVLLNSLSGSGPFATCPCIAYTLRAYGWALTRRVLGGETSSGWLGWCRCSALFCEVLTMRLRS